MTILDHGQKKEQRTEAIVGVKPVSKNISSKAAKTRKANSITALLKKKKIIMSIQQVSVAIEPILERRNPDDQTSIEAEAYLMRKITMECSFKGRRR